MSQQALFDLTGKRALITGSSRGVGYAMASGLAKAGAEILVNGRDTLVLGDAAKNLSDEGAKVTALAFDVTNQDSIADAITYAEENIGPIDILINNAGKMTRGALLDFPQDKFASLMSTNVDALLSVSQTVAPRMIARGAGKIINISSSAGKISRPGNYAYATTKSAVDSLTRGMASEWAPHGLNINAIAPGIIAAGMNEDVLDDQYINDFVSSRVPMRRWGQSDDVVGAAIFLSSDAASYINGHTLVVDGGLTATL